MSFGTYHYVVSGLDKTILAVYGNALREMAFEKASKLRSTGVECEVFTQTGERQAANAKFKRVRKC